jgi:murein DD-endopeptidase MepM/ murein hydrolase activator NlpD
MPLTLTGREVVDQDSRITYVEAKYTHDGVEFSGWFDENQTSLQTYRAEVRAQTARLQQEAFETLGEVALSGEALSLDVSADARNVREALFQRFLESPESFTLAEEAAASEPTEREYSSDFGPPVCGCTGRQCRISSGFGPRRSFRTTNGNWSSRNHRAWDVAGRSGTPVVAVADGRIISARSEGGWGRTIRVDHGNGLVVRYSHLSSYTLRSGSVSRGQEIGKIGSSGNVTGPHLDIAFIRNGTPVNPGNYISDRRSFLNQSCGAI